MTDPSTRGPIRTLVVDDDFRVAHLHAAHVSRTAGFEVVGRAMCAGQARELLERTGPDLLLLDLYLPDADGLELLAQLRAVPRPVTDVIVISAARDMARVQTAMRLGVLQYLIKPFAGEVLTDRLQAYAGLVARRDALRQVTQHQVDALIGGLTPAGSAGGARVVGPAPRTLDAVERLVHTSGAGVTAIDVASHIGLSRATAQRHLARLAQRGRAVIELRYHPLGRPEHVYHAPTARPRIHQTAAVAAVG